MVAGDRLVDIHRAEHRAGGVLCLLHRAVPAVQIRLKGVFHAVLADIGVRGVFEQGVFFILLLRHKSDVAEDVRGIVRAVFALVCAVDVYAGELVLHDGGYELHARVLDENIVRGVDGVADVDGISHTGNDAHLLRGVAVIYAVSRAHIAHQLHSRGVVRVDGDRFQIVLLVLDIRLEHGALYLGHVRVVLKRRLARDGQVVRIRVAVALHHVHKAQYRLVRVLVCKELRRVDREVIHLGVAHEHAPIAVEDVAARGGYGALLGRYLVALVIVFLALYYLELVKLVGVDRQQYQHQHYQCRDPAVSDKSVMHSSVLSPGEAKAVRTGAATLSTPPAGSTPARRAAATTASAKAQSLSSSPTIRPSRRS